MNEIWVAHYSVDLWQEPSCWTAYFAEVQSLLGLSLTHLDSNDPLRRKVVSLAEAAEFACEFKPRESSRCLFGKLGRSGLGFELWQQRQINRWPNRLLWYVPWSFAEKPEGWQRLKAMFNLGNRALKPFYAYCDELGQISSKKKKSGAVNIEAELLGVFWLTYFNASYVTFFGADKFNGFGGVEHGIDSGITLTLGDNPMLVTTGDREQVATTLGRQTFVSHNDILGKPPGLFSLTFQQLQDGAKLKR
jgi:hypothetical protein